MGWRPFRSRAGYTSEAGAALDGQVHDRFGLVPVLLVSSFVLAGLGDEPLHVLVAVLNGVVLVVASRATGIVGSWPGLAAVGALALLALVPVAVFDAREIGGGVAWLLQAALLTVVIVAITRRVLQHERVGLQTILGAVCVYVLIGMAFGTVYGAVGSFTDDVILVAHQGGEADPIYYSFVTLTTVGFGDVTSPIELIRRITVVEAIFGQVFLATMIARLVSMYGTVRGAGTVGPVGGQPGAPD